MAALTSGLLAIATVGAVSAYRQRAFRDESEQQARATAAFLSGLTGTAPLDRLVASYDGVDAEVVALTPDGSMSSTPRLSERTVPATLRSTPPGGTRATTMTIAGVRRYVVAVASPDAVTLVFYFSMRTLDDGLYELRAILAAGWLLSVAVALLVGQVMAQRTLRPVATAARTARAIRSGDLDARVPVLGDDEFALLAREFNAMADALQAKITEIAAAHDRERRFTADAAHDLLTPLSALVSAATLAEKRVAEAPPGLRRVIELIAGDARRTARLAEELLDLAALDAERSVSLAPVSLRDVLADVAASFGRDDLVIDAAADAVVVSDVTCLTRVVGNLVENAFAHGRPPVVVTACGLPDERSGGSYATIDVADHGEGIPAEHRGHVFERFYKADPARAAPGTGLGLAIAQESARLIGASVELVTTGPGRTVFRVTVPPAIEPTSGRELAPQPAEHG
ncbi:MAG TPA: HAMP domain-containing sensor histidine kinase [Acidimicrobiales bacterium]|nr:HAMP domain-containing sensor histidine kinase [Acidimicrobiales bacterium]